jgi:hypothetical protein
VRISSQAAEKESPTNWISAGLLRALVPGELHLQVFLGTSHALE